MLIIEAHITNKTHLHKHLFPKLFKEMSLHKFEQVPLNIVNAESNHVRASTWFYRSLLKCTALPFSWTLWYILTEWKQKLPFLITHSTKITNFGLRRVFWQQLFHVDHLTAIQLMDELMMHLSSPVLDICCFSF